MSTEIALVQFDEQDFLRAKNEELEKWQNMKVYQKVPKVEAKTIRTRWVLSVKNGKARVRLVAKRYQDHDVTDDPTLKDSPTCSKESLRILLLTIISKSWPLISRCESSLYKGNLSTETYISLPLPNMKTVIALGSC